MANADKIKPAKPGNLDQANPRRSLILFAIGALLGLSIAAYGLFTAEGTTTGGIPAEDIALVNGRHILRSDFVTQVEITTAMNFDEASREDHMRVLGDMINEELLVQRGMETDLAASDPDVRAAMVAGVNIQVTADVASREPADAELRAYYAANQSKYAGEGLMQVRDIFIRPSDEVPPPQARAAAQNAAKELRDDAALEAVMAKYNMQDSGKADADEMFDFAAKIKLGPETFDVASKLMAGEISEPFVLGGDVHLIQMIKRRAAVPREFAEARDTVLQDFKRDASRKVEEENLNYLKSRAEIVLAPEARQ